MIRLYNYPTDTNPLCSVGNADTIIEHNKYNQLIVYAVSTSQDTIIDLYALGTFTNLPYSIYKISLLVGYKMLVSCITIDYLPPLLVYIKISGIIIDNDYVDNIPYKTKVIYIINISKTMGLHRDNLPLHLTNHGISRTK